MKKIWRTFTLVVKSSKDSWMNMNINLHVIEEESQRNPGYYRIERWTYNRTDDGDKLIKQEVVTSFGIDVQSNCKEMLISRLGKLKDTIDISDGGMYHQDLSYSQVWIKTVWSEEKLEEWLYNVVFPRECEIVGVFEKEW